MSSLMLDSSARAAALKSRRDVDVASFTAGQKDTESLLKSAPWWNRVLLYLNMIGLAVVFFLVMMASGIAEMFAEYLPFVGTAVEVGVALVISVSGFILGYLGAVIAANLPGQKGVLFGVNLSMLAAIFALSTVTTAVLVLYAGESGSSQGRATSIEANAMGAEIALLQQDREQARITLLSANAELESAQAAHRAAAHQLALASRELTAWQQNVVTEFGQGTAPANRRLDPSWPEHANLRAAIETARTAETNALAVARSAVAARNAAAEEAKLASDGLVAAMRLQRDLATGPNNWERTWAGLGGFFGLSGQDFLIFFGAFASVLISLASYTYAYSNSAMITPVIKEEETRAAKVREQALEGAALRAGNIAAPSGGAKPGLMASAIQAVAPSVGAGASAAPTPKPFGDLMEKALGREDPALPCGLKQSQYDRFLSTHADAFSRLEADAKAGMISSFGERALRDAYGGDDRAGKAYKHWLTVEGLAEYNSDGSIKVLPSFKAAA